MSITYTPTTNFGSKDSLPSNDPNKVIKGAEFTTEFTAIQSAFGLAASASNPTFTGTATFDNLTVTSNFTSRGIDDNATATALTVTDSGIAATLTTAAQPNITSVGVLAGFTSTGIDDNATSTAMRIDSGGRLLVGTSSFGYAGVDLTVGDTADSQNGVAIQSSPTGFGYLLFGDGAGADSYRGQVSYKHGDDYMAMRTAGSERMRIDASGNLLVGTTDPAGGGTSGVTISDVSDAIGQVNIAKSYSGITGAMKFYFGTTQVGRIDYSDTSTTYVTSSDERLKENVTDAPVGNIDSIKVRSFDWKSDGSHQEYGFIAQELETVAPYAVSKGETDEDTWGVDYSKLVPMLVKEIQDLKAEVEALKNA